MYDAANRLTQWGAITLTYDDNGNLTSDGLNSYTWNARNQLASMTGANFQYDAFGRRKSKTVGGATTQFLYDGVNPAQEIGGAAANLLTGLGIDEVFTRTDSSGTRHFLTDALGSTLALADGAGAVQTQYTYEPFGQVTVNGPSSANPFQYTGRENDGTGLYYYRARYYHPGLQRFISEDPLGFAGGDADFYAYVGGAPADLTDPSGMTDAPGFAESLIPIWGSGRQAVHDFECGDWASGFLNTALAASDAFLVKSLASTIGKVAVGGLAKISGSHTWDATRKWMTSVGWRDLPGLQFHHWAIPQNGWGAGVPQVVKNQPWNITKLTAEEHTAMHQMTGVGRLWAGSPTWGKVATADAVGKGWSLTRGRCECR